MTPPVPTVDVVELLRRQNGLLLKALMRAKAEIAQLKAQLAHVKETTRP